MSATQVEQPGTEHADDRRCEYCGEPIGSRSSVPYDDGTVAHGACAVWAGD